MKLYYRIYDPTHRNNVNLLIYKNDIENIIIGEMPSAIVHVYPHEYIIEDIVNEFTNTLVRKIGSRIAKETSLGRYAKTHYYNNGKNKSTKLFKRYKSSK